MDQTDIILKRVLQMVSDQDELFVLLDNEYITTLFRSGLIMITHEVDMSGTFLTEFGRNKLNELINKS